MTDLKDLTFLIPVKIDSDDRLSNLDIIVSYLQENFNSEIIVCEQDTEPKLKDRYNCKYIYIPMGQNFNKSKSINTAAKAASTPVIAVYDADTLLTVNQITKSTKIILDNQADVIYPYDGRFYDVPKNYHQAIKENKDLSIINLDDCKLFNKGSVGGAVFYNKEIFLKFGGANQKFEGWGYEDNELFVRFTKVGARVARVTKPLLHLTHERVKPAFYNPLLEEKNRLVMELINYMSPAQILQEINSWSWK